LRKCVSCVSLLVGELLTQNIKVNYCFALKSINLSKLTKVTRVVANSQPVLTYWGTKNEPTLPFNTQLTTDRYLRCCLYSSSISLWVNLIFKCKIWQKLWKWYSFYIVHTSLYGIFLKGLHMYTWKNFMAQCLRISTGLQSVSRIWAS